MLEAGTQLDTDIEEGPCRPETAPNLASPKKRLMRTAMLRPQSGAISSRVPGNSGKSSRKPVSFAWKQVAPRFLQKNQPLRLNVPQTLIKPVSKPLVHSKTAQRGVRSYTQRISTTKSFDRFPAEKPSPHHYTASAAEPLPLHPESISALLEHKPEFRSYAEPTCRAVSIRAPLHLRAVSLQLQGVSYSVANSKLPSPEPSSPLPVPQLATVRLMWTPDQSRVILQSCSQRSGFRGSKVSSSRGVRFLRRPCARVSPNHFLAL